MQSADDMTTGYNNVCVGKDAGTDITTSHNNTLIGLLAGSNITTSDGTQGCNICLGDNTTLSAATDDRSMVLGHNTTGLGSGTTIIRGGNGVFNSQNTTTWNTTSDERIKKNIVDNNIGLNIINQIQVRNFDYRTEEEIVDFDSPKAAVVKREGTQIGVIAQEIEKVLPQVVETLSTGVKTVDPSDLTWYLVNAVKELSAEVTALKAA